MCITADTFSVPLPARCPHAMPAAYQRARSSRTPLTEDSPARIPRQLEIAATLPIRLAAVFLVSSGELSESRMRPILKEFAARIGQVRSARIKIMNCGLGR